MPRFHVPRRLLLSDERQHRSTSAPHRAVGVPERPRRSGPGAYLQDIQRRAGNSATLQLLGSGATPGGAGAIQRTPSSVKDKIDFFEKGGAPGSSGGGNAPVISERVSDFKNLLSKFKGSEASTKTKTPTTGTTETTPANEEKDPRTPGGLSYGGVTYGSSYTSDPGLNEEKEPRTPGGLSYGGVTYGSSYTSDPGLNGEKEPRTPGGLSYGGVTYGSSYTSDPGLNGDTSTHGGSKDDEIVSGGYVPNNLEEDKQGTLTKGGVGYGSKKQGGGYGNSRLKYDVDPDEFVDEPDDELSDDEEEPEVKAKEPEYDSFEPGRRHGRTLSKFSSYDGEEISSIGNLKESMDDLKKVQAKRAEKGETVSLGQLAIEQLGWSQSDVDNYMSESGELKLPKVKYLEEPTERASYELRGGSPFYQGTDEKPFTTEGMFSKHSGKDWGIYVMDPDGKLYAGQHRVGLFHHSTFMAGANVSGAGEIKVSKDGKLEHITNKTGHYKGDSDHLWQAVDEFNRRGIPLASFKVSTYNHSIHEESAEKFYRSHKLKQLKLKEEPKPAENLEKDDYRDDDDDDAGYTSDAEAYKTTVIDDGEVKDGDGEVQSGGYVPNNLSDESEDEKAGGGLQYTTPDLAEDKDDGQQEDDDLVSVGGYTTNYTSKDEDD